MSSSRRPPRSRVSSSIAVRSRSSSTAASRAPYSTAARSTSPGGASRRAMIQASVSPSTTAGAQITCASPCCEMTVCGSGAAASGRHSIAASAGQRASTRSWGASTSISALMNVPSERTTDSSPRPSSTAWARVSCTDEDPLELEVLVLGLHVLVLQPRDRLSLTVVQLGVLERHRAVVGERRHDAVAAFVPGLRPDAGEEQLASAGARHRDHDGLRRLVAEVEAQMVELRIDLREQAVQSRQGLVGQAGRLPDLEAGGRARAVDRAIEPADAAQRSKQLVDDGRLPGEAADPACEAGERLQLHQSIAQRGVGCS